MRALPSISRRIEVMTVSYPRLTAARWYWMAPRYLPRPIVIIFKRPDSIEPWKGGWGGPVSLSGPRVLAQADRHHLEETRLDRALEVGMGLHPVDEPDPVGLGGD